LNNKKTNSYHFQTFLESYKSFSPSVINQSFEWKDKQINILLELTTHALGELNGLTAYSNNYQLFVPYLQLREVLASNMIEGNSLNLHEYFFKTDTLSELQQQEQQQANCYNKSIIWAFNELNKYPLSIRLIKQAHKILYSSSNKTKELGGKLRTVGKYSTTVSPIKDFTPPNRDELKHLINDAKKFWNNDSLQLPLLIKMAISLFQFENILPFVDGNGRTARTLTLLQLNSLKFMTKPVLSPSVIFNQNRMEYYHRLNLVRTNNDIEQWIRFFLSVLHQSATENIQLLIKAAELNTKNSLLITNNLPIKRRKQGIAFLELITQTPIITVKEIAQHFCVSFQAANNFIREFEKLGLINELSGAKRNRIFSYSELIELFELQTKK